MAEQWECSILSECIYEIAQIQWLLFDPWFTFQQMKYHFVCGRLFESYSILKLIILRFWWFYRGQNEIYTTRSTIASFVKELNQNYNMTFSQAKRLCSPLYQHQCISVRVHTEARIVSQFLPWRPSERDIVTNYILIWNIQYFPLH